jgi:hypothetical protein
MYTAKTLTLTAALFVLLAAPGATLADPVTLTFGELTPRPAHGVSIAGVTFGFTVRGLPSRDAVYNSVGPGSLAFIRSPSLVGNAAGVLVLAFDVPVDSLSFGVALSSLAPFSPGFVVALFDADSNPLGVFGVATAPVLTFSEGQFRFSGALVSRVVVIFNPTAASFAFDNLTFNPVPEPATLLLVGAALAVGAVRRARQRRPASASSQVR